MLDNKYGFDQFNQWFFGSGSVQLGKTLWQHGDVTFIDNVIVNGSAKLVGWFAGVARLLQTGLLYHYAFVMFVGLLALLTGFVLL